MSCWVRQRFQAAETSTFAGITSHLHSVALLEEAQVTAVGPDSLSALSGNANRAEYVRMS